MIGRLSSVAIALAALLSAAALVPDPMQQTQAATYYPSGPALFYNYYVPPGAWGGVPAQLYLCPLPTPPVVGHTYVTYQALAPQEFLYPHCRKYWSYNAASGGWTRTVAVWRRSYLPLDDLLFCPW